MEGMKFVPKKKKKMRKTFNEFEPSRNNIIYENQ